MRSWRRVQWLPIDEWEGGFGWILDERIGRASHALLVDGRVWLTDPLDVPGLDDRVRALGAPAGVLQLLDRHNRDSAAIAQRLGVPLVRAWETLREAPFTALVVRDNRVWREVALWEPQQATLVCADALGTLPFFRAGGERVGWHPFIRPLPPRSFRGLAPARILVGHGRGVADGAADAFADVVAHGRRRLLGAYARAVRTSVRAASR
jgi:hypothetical protein